jgi:hypothetical protein
MRHSARSQFTCRPVGGFSCALLMHLFEYCGKSDKISNRNVGDLEYASRLTDELRSINCGGLWAGRFGD